MAKLEYREEHELIKKYLEGHPEGQTMGEIREAFGEDGVKLHVDHKIPKSWGGKSEENNLWTLCADCNQGKKNFLASFDPAQMKEVMKYDSVHKRLAELLRINVGEWVDSDILEWIANSINYQQDWQKRLRELRSIGFDIECRTIKQGKRKTSQYRIMEYPELSDEPSAAVREFEHKMEQKRKEKRKEAQ